MIDGIRLRLVPVSESEADPDRVYLSAGKFTGGIRPCVLEFLDTAGRWIPADIVGDWIEPERLELPPPDPDADDLNRRRQ